MTKVCWGQNIPASAGIEIRNRIINNTSIYLLLAHVQFITCYALHAYTNSSFCRAARPDEKQHRVK